MSDVRAIALPSATQRCPSYAIHALLMPLGGIAVLTGRLVIVRPLVPTACGGAAVVLPVVATGTREADGGGVETRSYGRAKVGGAGACATNPPALRSSAPDVSTGNAGWRLPAVSASMPARKCSYGCIRAPEI